MHNLELIPFEILKPFVPACFERLHEFLSSIQDSNILTYQVPYIEKMDWFEVNEEFKEHISNIRVDNHWMPDTTNPKYWEYEAGVSMFKNPYKRIASQTLTFTLKKGFYEKD